MSARPAFSPTPAVEQFIEGLGILAQQDGMPRIAGRMLALFIVNGGPFSFSELAERLQVSRASISTNARILRELGYIERLGRPGDRQDYYRLSDDPYRRLLEGHVMRIRARLALLDKLARSMPEANESHERIMRMRRFYSAALTATEELMDNFSDEVREDDTR